MTREEALGALALRRDKIDEVDRRILALLNERTRTVEEIGRIKHAAQLPVYEPRREDQVFQNIADHNEGPLTTAAARSSSPSVTTVAGRQSSRASPGPKRAYSASRPANRSSGAQMTS